MSTFLQACKTLTRFLLDALFPPQCIPCGKKLPSSSQFVSACDECIARIPIRSGFTCSMCGARQASLHNECHKSAIVIAAATDYTNREAQMLIHALKYDQVQTAVQPLVEILMWYIASREELLAHNGFVLVPIPLHAKKMRERGFNQAELITKELCAQLPIKFLYCGDALTRSHNTPSQTAQKSHAERNKNMKDAFAVQNSDGIEGKIVFLVDDVSTSGATIREAARVLKNAGARSVFGLVVAKA